MGRLLRMLLRSSGLFTFIVLELLSFYLIVSHNDLQRRNWLETRSVYSNRITAVVNERLAFLDAAAENERLRRQNADLLARLSDSGYRLGEDTTTVRDSAFRQRYTYLAARVVNKSPYGPYNTLVLDRGRQAGIRRGQGVVATGGGLLGIVSEVSGRHARLVSVLHLDTRLSAGLANNAYGTLRWEGHDPRRATVTDVPDYVAVVPGDTVYTTGYSNVFPTGLPIGTVEDSEPLPGTGSQNLTVLLINDPLSAGGGYVVHDLFKEELDQLNRVR